ncbi:MAG TPA: type VI secretion system baseplate subunit TssF [Alphaproteobacteria bacterium]|nr:type VI secretion system baseplate subunit TssF [Alphaproteobacteria bacterium]
MVDDLLIYYERELSYIRQLGAEFAAKYPKIAGRLLLEAEKSEDPHVERLIQAFAFLAARIHRKIDDEFPEITDALLGVLYPHYLAPIPSMSIVQFVLDAEQGKLTSGHHLPQGTPLYSQPVGGTPCRFRTCYPVTLWPIEVVAARLEEPDRLRPAPEAVAVLRVELRCQGGTTVEQLDLHHLRFFLQGESALVYGLYELLFNNACCIQLRAPGDRGGIQHIDLPRDSLRAVGFGAEEAVLPYTARSFVGYRLLQEYFAFPEKYLFFELFGLDHAVRAGFRERLDVLIFLDRMPRLEQPINAGTFRLGCTPVINLFEQIAEPIRLNQAQTEYRVIPDIRRQQATEVYAVTDVVSTSPHLRESVTFQPFYSIKHPVDHDQRRAFWYAVRRPSPRKGDTGTELYLSLVDSHFQPTLPPIDTLTVHVTCTNRDLPGKLPFGGERGDFELEGAAPIARIRCLKKPTETIRPPLRRGAQWRLISHLSLNYLSICEGGREALQEMLKLYDYSDSAVIRQQIAGIVDVRSRRVVGRPPSMPWNGFCRGLEVTLQFDEEKYVGSGVFLFAAVLEKFIGLYASLNSFTQLVATTLQREEPLKRWPPRAGEQILL